MEQSIKKISDLQWVNRWAGSYTFISCSYWGAQYYLSLKKNLGEFFSHTLFIHRKGVVSFYITEREFKRLGNALARKSERNTRFVKAKCEAIKKNTDIILPIMGRLQKVIPTLAEYKTFLKYFDRHLALHVYIKKTVDFLPTQKGSTLLDLFKDARQYSEKVYSESERFFRSVMKFIASKEGYTANNLTCLTQHEFEWYLKNGTLPAKSVLRKRYEASVLFFIKGRMTLFHGNDVDTVQEAITQRVMVKKNKVTGVAAYPGRVTGRARIVLNPFNVGVYKKGAILITGMTRPEFIPLMKKSAAIITDVGGTLCHAAISARELKIPCVVGTAVATKVFKNGDLLEVNATDGVIKKINS